MKIILNNKEEIELSEREEMIYAEAESKTLVPAILTGIAIGLMISLLLAMYNPASAQSTRPIYRQTLIIKSNKPVPITWQKVNVNYLDKIYEYDRKLKKRRLVLIVFGKEGTSPLSEWMKYEVKEGDTIYNYERHINLKQTKMLLTSSVCASLQKTYLNLHLHLHKYTSILCRQSCFCKKPRLFIHTALLSWLLI